MTGARTAGTSQIAYSESRSTGNTRLSGSKAAQARPHAQNTTPKATPISAVTRMSRVRHATIDGAGAGLWARSTVVTTLPSGSWMPSSDENGVRRAWACFLRRYEPDQVPRVCGRATLSARVRSPEAVFALPGDGTAGGSAGCRRGHPADPIADPVDDVADDPRAVRFVVQLVEHARVHAANDAGPIVEGLARRGRDEPVRPAVNDQRGDGQPIQGRRDPPLLGKERVTEANRCLVLVERV